MRAKEVRMRVATLFKRLLRIDGVRVVDVELTEDERGPLVVVRVERRRRRVLACSGCGQVMRAVYDHVERRWRHRDVLGVRCQIRCRLCRLCCPECGVQPEAVPFARPGARFTRSFEDSCVWLCRHAPRSVVARLMHVDWASVGRMCERLAGEQLARRAPLSGLRRIGVDEVSWREGHHYLTVVSCHETGRVVWVGRGDRAQALERFFDELGPHGCARLAAISADLGPAYLGVIARRAAQAAVCADPFHLVQMAHFALDRVRTRSWQRLRRSDPEAARWLKGARFALRRGPARRTDADEALIAELERENQDVYRAWLWVEQLRAVLRDRRPACESWFTLRALADAAGELGHPRFSRLGRTLRRHAEHVLNTIRLGLSNGRIEAMNSTVRLLSHRARGFRRVESLIALIHLVCGRLHVELPT
jgi:transposase